MPQRRSAARRTASRHSGKPQVQPPSQPRITDNSWPSQGDGLNRRFDKLTADLGKGEDTGAPLLCVFFGVRGTPSRMVVLVAPAQTARGLPRCGMQAHYAQGMCLSACRLIREKAVQVADTRTGSTVMAIKTTDITCMDSSSHKSCRPAGGAH